MTLTRSGFVGLLVINTLVAVIYLIWGMLRAAAAKGRETDEGEKLYDNRRTYLLRFFIMVFCPIIGILFFFVSWVLYLTVFRFQVNLADVTFGKDQVRTQIKADEERERNVIPVEEAVVISDKRSMRMAMMSVIKGDVRNAMGAIALALSSEESETAHYAASALSEILNDFRVEVNRRRRAIREEAPDETQCEEEMLEFMDEVLKQGVFTASEQYRFVHIMENAAESLYQKNPLKFTEAIYESVCLRLIEAGDFENSEKWCLRQTQQYPQQLSSFSCSLKLYYTMKDREAFFRTLTELKKSDVVIDNETLELIRVFS